MLSSETAFDDVSASICADLLILQREDPFIVDKTRELCPSLSRTGSEGHWRIDDSKLLRYRGAVYTGPESVSFGGDSKILRRGAGRHLGTTRTLDLITRKYWWPSLRKDPQAYVESCAECQRAKSRRH